MFVNYYKTEVEITPEGDIVTPKIGRETSPSYTMPSGYAQNLNSGLNPLIDFHEGLMVVGSDMTVQKSQISANQADLTELANTINSRLNNGNSMTRSTSFINRSQPLYIAVSY